MKTSEVIDQNLVRIFRACDQQLWHSSLKHPHDAVSAFVLPDRNAISKKLIRCTINIYSLIDLIDVVDHVALLGENAGKAAHEGP